MTKEDFFKNVLPASEEVQAALPQIIKDADKECKELAERDPMAQWPIE